MGLAHTHILYVNTQTANHTRLGQTCKLYRTNSKYVNQNKSLSLAEGMTENLGRSLNSRLFEMYA